MTRLHQGVYAWSGTSPGRRDRVRALTAALREDLVISHQTAADVLGLPTVGAQRGFIHLTVPAGTSTIRRTGVRAHRSEIAMHERMKFGELTVTKPARIFVDLAAQGVSLEELVAFGDAILHHEWVTETMLAHAVHSRFRHRGVRIARQALPLLDGRAESVPESLLRVRIIFAGLPKPEPQVKVFDERGRLIARLDLGYDEIKVGIDYDGRHHAKRKQFGRDLARYTELASLGWHILRPGSDDLDDGSRLFLSRLRRRLEAA